MIEQFISRQEAESIPNEQAPIRALVRYLKNRPGQFEYKTAIDQQLPIGSGKIESAYRSLSKGLIEMTLTFNYTLRQEKNLKSY